MLFVIEHDTAVTVQVPIDAAPSRNVITVPESNALGVAVYVTVSRTRDGFALDDNKTVGCAFVTVKVYVQVPAVFAESRAVPETEYLPGSKALFAVRIPADETEISPTFVVLKTTAPVAPSN